MKVNEKKGLICVQGGVQFIAGYIAYRWCEEKIWFGKSKITLLIYDTCVPTEIEVLFQNTIKEIANIVNIHKIIFINEIDSNRISKNYYAKSISKFKCIIGEENFDYLFLALDYGTFLSKLIPNAYPKSLKIEYGDSFGLVGNKKNIAFSLLQIFRTPVIYLKVVLKKIVYRQYHKSFPFELSVLTMPLVWDPKYLSNKKLVIPDMKFVKNIVSQISNKMIQLNNYCEQLISNTNKCNVYLLSNFYNSGFCTFENEIRLYEQIILETALIGQRVILKNHPRASNKMLNQLKERLDKKFEVKLVTDNRYKSIPIELWGVIMDKCEVFPIYSTSSISLKYLFSKSVVLTLDIEKINKYFYPDKREVLCDGVNMMNIAIKTLEKWDFDSPLWIKN